MLLLQLIRVATQQIEPRHGGDVAYLALLEAADTGDRRQCVSLHQFQAESFHYDRGGWDTAVMAQVAPQIIQQLFLNSDEELGVRHMNCSTK